MSADKLCSFYGFTRIPFRRDLAHAMLHRHRGHAEAVAPIPLVRARDRAGRHHGEVGAGKTVALRAALADPTDRYRLDVLATTCAPALWG
jgi:type II secretory pathway predicted ATPase ExeA